MVFAADPEHLLADMSGDGLTDIVRIRNGSVDYWPNLGYGRFGKRVSMAHAPRYEGNDRFDQGRIRLADVTAPEPRISSISQPIRYATGKTRRVTPGAMPV